MGIALLPKSVLTTFSANTEISVHKLTTKENHVATVLIWRKGARSPKTEALSTGRHRAASRTVRSVEAVATATQRGYRVGAGEPYHGYYYKILTSQGANAPGGAVDYVVRGSMIGGFGLVVAAAHDRIGPDRLHFLRQHADIGLVAAVVDEAIEAQAVVKMTDERDVVFERDVRASSPATTTTTFAATTTTTAAHARATATAAHAWATTTSAEAGVSA